MVALARFFDWREALVIRQAGNLPQMASKRLPAVLEMEIAKTWPSCPAVEPARNHS
jgi:hypothetical protein